MNALAGARPDAVIVGGIGMGALLGLRAAGIKAGDVIASVDGTSLAGKTPDEATALMCVPDRVVIIGGGVIGLEFADAYVNFGSSVDVVELTPSVTNSTGI